MAKKAPKKIDYKKYIRQFWAFFSAAVFIVVLLFFSISMGWLGFMPGFEELENPKSNLASEVISADQKLLGKYFIENFIYNIFHHFIIK